MRARALLIFFSLFLLLSMLHGPALGQQHKRVKQEVERAIRVNEMPEKARTLMQPFLSEANRLKYYHEQQFERITYEAKFNFQEKKLSVEFTDEGSLIDIEQLISAEEIDEGTRFKIIEYFRSKFRQHRFLRIQQQYAADDEEIAGEEVVSQFLENEGANLRIRYEIEAEVKNQDKLGPYEFIFDRDGSLIKERKIIRRPADNVLY